MSTARAAIARTAGDEITIEEIDIGSPGPGEVQIRILASGVCHSDLHFKQGVLGDDHPFLLGHECAGIVEDVGPGVESVEVGDYVALTYRAPCGSCRFCSMANTARCESPVTPGSKVFTVDGLELTRVLDLGTLAERVVVAAAQAIRIPESLPPAQACLLGCGVITGIGAVLNSARVRPGETVAVIGCGGVGANVIQGARLARASRIVALDLDDRKLESAKALGATEVFNPSMGSAESALREIASEGVDYVFDVVGSPKTLASAFDMLGYRGTVVLVGVPPATSRYELPLMEFFLKGASLKTCLGGDSVPSRDFQLLAESVSRGELDLGRLVSREIPLTDVNDAFAAMEAGEVLRSVVVFETD